MRKLEGEFYKPITYFLSRNLGVVWRGRSPSKYNPQQRHARCEDEFFSEQE